MSASGAPPSPDRLGARDLLLQFVLIPLALAGVCSAIFFGIQWMTAAPRSGSDLSEGLKDPDPRARWIAALEAARMGVRDPETLRVLVDILEARGLDDAAQASAVDALEGESWTDVVTGRGRQPMKIRWFAAQALGRSGNGAAVGPLRAALLKDPDAGVRMYAALALGELAAPGAAADLSQALQADADAGVRKAASFSLGFFDTAESRAALAKGLADADTQVRWNAALALARLADPAACGVLARMLDRGAVSALEVASLGGSMRRVSGQEVQMILVGAIHAAARFKDEGLAARLAALESDADLRVSTEAKKARLAALGGPPRLPPAAGARSRQDAEAERRLVPE